MKTLKLPGLDDTYTFLQNDTTLAVSGKAADAKATGDALAAVQAQVDGVQAGQYPDMGAGQLLSESGTLNPSPYTYRENASGSDRVTISQITGGTVAFNQLERTVAGTKTYNGCTWTVSDDGVVSVSGTATTKAYLVSIGAYDSIAIDFVNGHKYLYNIGNAQYVGSSSNVAWYIPKADGMEMANINLYSPYGIVVAQATYTSYMQCAVASGATVDTQFRPQLFDLTQMFGSAVADYIYGLETETPGAGVAFFREMFPESYYPYNAGELLSVQTSGRKTVGFNLFDKEAATLGKYYMGSGQENPLASRGHSDFIRVTPGVSYHMNVTPITNVYRCIFFDSDKRYVNRVNTDTFTAPAGAVYMAINFLLEEIDSIVVNISDPSRDGQYEPYSAHTYPLDSALTLRGVPVLSGGVPAYDGDQYTSGGTVTRRYGIVDLGTLTWEKANTNIPDTYRMLSRSLSDIAKTASSNSSKGNLICSLYPTLTWNETYNANVGNGIAVYSSAGTICVFDSAYDSPSAFKTAVSGVYLVYELATPTTETAAPYQEIQIAGSTEEFLPPETDTRPAAVPVGSVSLYQTNLRAGLETLLGTDLAHAESIAPVQGATASTNIASGELLMRDGKLYQATQAIVAGAEIGSTNTTETTLAAQLAALEARIAALEN